MRPQAEGEAAYPGAIRSRQPLAIGLDSVQVLEHWVVLAGIVRLEAEARIKREVFAEIVNSEIANVELDPIAPVFCDLGRVDQCHAHCSFDEDSIACQNITTYSALYQQIIVLQTREWAKSRKG